MARTEEERYFFIRFSTILYSLFLNVLYSSGMIRQFFTEVDWGETLEYLIIDTPPGTSDEHLSLAQFLKEVPNVKAVIVTTPQEVSLLDVRKEIDFLRKVKIPILGVVENMSTFVCPKCNVSTYLRIQFGL